MFVSPIKIAISSKIQWHLNTTEYDSCETCGGELGWLGKKERICMAGCGTYLLQCSRKQWKKDQQFVFMVGDVSMSSTHRAQAN